jgi:hypothetical protein
MSGPARAETRTVEAVNRRGRSFTCTVRVLPLLTPAREVTGALLLMADSEHAEVGSMPPV